MRRLPAALLVCLCLAAQPALASETYPAPDAGLRLPDGARVLPGDPVWPLGERAAPHALCRIEAAGAEGFRLNIMPRQGATPAPSAPRACLGLASSRRLDLYKTRAVEFRVRASRPVAGILMVTSSNTQDRLSRDRFFGSFGIGTRWKTLRLTYGALAPLPGWDAFAARSGLHPGDHVLRPDSVEELCIGVEAGRLDPEGGGQGAQVEIDGLRFVR
ncbi:hypothetical protein SAMN04488503_2384 [Humidesulfovibrio mexicanus]|uniref:Complex I intermediate-associated protein 30 (CIA30) n=1 Tax=Humidesulfovibrio mexicanus TaxID=147047 RepID=A0A239B2L0_9BACT|nr:hypothetical protein [Humidesulfovibrio mexicanus]SNS02040.1 hypothetical protein SAMN04488503_2384 [Humidesulfovibrio mexicanus]